MVTRFYQMTLARITKILNGRTRIRKRWSKRRKWHQVLLIYCDHCLNFIIIGQEVASKDGYRSRKHFLCRKCYWTKFGD